MSTQRWLSIRRPSFGALARGLLGCILVASAAEAAPQRERPHRMLERARGHLRAGELELGQEVLESALQYHDDDVPLLELAAATALDLGDRDLGAWYGHRAVEQARRLGRATTVDRRVRDLLEQVGGDVHGERLDAHAHELYQLGRKCLRRRLYANAADLLLRCRGTALDQKARAELDKLFANKKAASALLRAGIPLGAAHVSERERARLRARDEAHSAWEDAYRDKTRNYTIETNMGYEMLEDVKLAMELLHREYRQIFGFKGRTSQCTIRIYRTREEFDLHEGEHSPAVKGFYRPSRNLVVTYDPRTETPPRPIEAL